LPIGQITSIAAATLPQQASARTPPVFGGLGDIATTQANLTVSSLRASLGDR